MRKLARQIPKTVPADVLAREHAALARARACWPTLQAFADAVGVPYQQVQNWQKRRLPSKYCARIARLTRNRVKREELREDWPEIVRGWW